MSGSSSSPRPVRRWRMLAVALGVPIGLVALLLVLWSSHRRPDPAATEAAASARARSGPLEGGSPAGIEGVVVDAQGRGVAGARVAAIAQSSIDGLILRLSEARPAIELPRVVVSGEGGRFEIPGLPAGRYALTATAAGLAAGARAGIELAPGAWAQNVEVRLGARGFTLDGRVVDFGGGTVAGARVRAIATGLARAGDQLVFETVSDEQGAYSLGLAPGRYALMAEADGYAPAHDFADVDGPETRQIRLQPAGGIAGRVVTGAGAGVAQAEVRVEPLDQPEDAIGRSVTTDEQGRFALPGLVAGSYRVVARKGELVGTSAHPVRLAVAARKDDLEIRLQPGVVLEGTVRGEDGEVVASAALWAVPEDLARGSRPVHRRVQSDAKGRFRLDGLLTGVYKVRVQAPGFTSKEEPIPMVEPGVVRKDMVLAAELLVTGEVLDAGGAPVAGARVEGQVQPRRAGLILADRTETDERGQFVLRRLAPGELRLAARTDGGVVNAPVQVLPPGHTGRFTLRLQPGARLSGTVAWDDGQPAANVLVVAQSRAVGITHVLEARSDGEGRFSVGPLPPGNASVHAVPPDERAAHLASSDAPQVDLALTPGEDRTDVALKVFRRSDSIRGLVNGPDGQPVGDALLSIEKEQDGLPVTDRTRRASTGADGSFVIESLARGTYTVIATHPRYTEVKRRGVVTGGGTVRLAFEPAASLAGMVVTSGGEPVGTFALTVTPAGPRTMPAVAPGTIPPPPAPPRPPEEVRSASGEFELGALAAGTYKLTAVAPDGAAAELRDITLRDGESRRGLRLVVQAGRRIRVAIKDFDSGRALAGALVEVRSPAGIKLRAAADGTGHATLSGVPRAGGALNVVFRGPDASYTTENRELTAAENENDETDLGQVLLVKARASGEGPTAYAQVDFVPEGDRLLVADGPGAGAALPPGAVVVAVDGRDARGVGMNGMRTLLAGPPESEMTFTLRGADQVAREVKIPRIAAR